MLTSNLSNSFKKLFKELLSEYRGHRFSIFEFKDTNYSSEF